MREGFKKSRFAIKTFLLLFTSVFIVLSVIFITAENYDIKGRIREIKNSELSFLEKNSMFFCSYFSRAASDILYLKNDIEKSDRILEDNWRILLESNRIYSSVRYIDGEGKEKLKGVYSSEGYMKAANVDLDDISDREYFIEFLQLSKDDIYISNVYFYKDQEGQDVPSIVFLANVEYDGTNGMVALDLNMPAMMQDFAQQVAGKEGGLYFVGDSGFWSKELNKYSMLSEKYYKLAYAVGILPPEHWKKIHALNYTINENGMYVFYEIDNSQNIITDKVNLVFREPIYKIVSLIPRGSGYDYYFDAMMSDIVIRAIAKNYLYYILGFLFSAVIVAYLMLNKSKFEIMRNSSHFDPLTKAYNRSQGLKLLEEAADKISSYKTICVCYVDINGLKQVNDTLGHDVGDELIKTVTNTVHNMIREDDVLIRMGGDEFIIVFNKVCKAIAETIWSRIVTALKAINSMEDRNYLISVSHGIVEIQNDGKKVNIDSIVTEADEKMYQEKIRIKKTFSSIRRK